MSNSILLLLKTICSSNITIEDWNTLIQHIASGDSTIENLVSEIQTLSADVELKANAADVYTKTETDNLLDDKQAAITQINKLLSDLVDDADCNNKFVTTTEKFTWNAKQNAIDSSHKLNADLVDDFSSTHKFVTSGLITQIQENVTDISNIKNDIKQYSHIITFGSTNHATDLGSIVIVNNNATSYTDESLGKVFQDMDKLGYSVNSTTRHSAGASPKMFNYSLGGGALNNKFYATSIILGASVTSTTTEIAYYTDVVTQL